MSFVHLRARSSNTLFEGLLSPKALVKHAKDNGHEAVALADLRTLSTAIQFQDAAKDAGVKPIFGLEVWLDTDLTEPHEETEGEAVDEDGVEKPASLFENPRLSSNNEPPRLLLLAETDVGYKNLLALLSRANRDNMVSKRPLVKQSWLMAGMAEGIIALTGDPDHGELARAATLEDPKDASSAVRRILPIYQKMFPNRLFLEVSRFGHAKESLWVERMAKLSASRAVPLVATNPVMFGERKDFFTHEVRSAIVRGKKVLEPSYDALSTREQYYQSTSEMEELFSDLPEAIENAGLIAERCVATIPVGVNKLPNFPLPEGERDIDSFFARLADEGLTDRLKINFPDPSERAAKEGEYRARLKMEVDIITQMVFPGYFLVVSDFIRWSKAHDIMIGPGRGSAAGSLVAYALNITDIDPLPYNLLFERFLNPERVSMPDIDTDFGAGRDDTIRYLFDRYGHHSVAQILALGNFGAKDAVRGAGRALDYPYKRVDEVARLIPKKPVDIKLTEALFGNENPKRPMVRIERLHDLYETDKQVRRLLDIALKIEGTPKSYGLHAGGVVISPTVIEDFAPVQPATGKDILMTQFDKNDVERAGLIKFDLLGLSNLDMIRVVVDLVNARPDRAENPLKLSDIPHEDEPSFELLREGNTFGLFQVESSGMQELLRDLRPTTFEDVVAVLALYRPGPMGMGMHKQFAKRKHGQEEISYYHPSLEKILAPTYGIIVYQEQVMQIAQTIAGYSLGEADMLRRAMGKKDAAKMAKERHRFEEGAVKNDVDPVLATELFDLLEKFADYGFNKSHSAAYAVVTMYTTFLKARYPVEYMAGWMTAHAESPIQLGNALAETHARGILVLPPDINASGTVFDVADVPGKPGIQAVRYALSALKGVSENVAKEIVAARDISGPFDSLTDFLFKFSAYVRAQGKMVPLKGMTEALIKAGAFDRIHPDRAQAFAALPDMLVYLGKVNRRAAKSTEDGDILLLPLWNSIGITSPVPAPRSDKRPQAEIVEPTWPEEGSYEPWDDLTRLAGELASVGFYLTGHPSRTHYEQLGGLESALSLSKLEEYEGSGFDQQLIAGIIEDVRTTVTKKTQEKMAFITIGDGSSTKEITMFARTYADIGHKLVKGAFMGLGVFVRDAKPRQGEDVPRTVKDVSVDSVLTRSELEAGLVEQVHIATTKEGLSAIKEIHEIHGITAADARQDPLAHFAATCLYLPDQKHPDRTYRAEAPEMLWRVSPDCVQALKDTFGDRVRLVHRARYPFPPDEGPKNKSKNKNQGQRGGNQNRGGRGGSSPAAKAPSALAPPRAPNHFSPSFSSSKSSGNNPGQEPSENEQSPSGGNNNRSRPRP